MSAAPRPSTTAERAIGIDRNRSVTPRAASVATAIMVASRPNSHRQGEHAGHEELEVARRRRHRHRAAEQVAEHQHDQHREEQAEHQRARLADPVRQVAAGDGPGVGQGPAQPLDRRPGMGGSARSRSCRHLRSLVGRLGRCRSGAGTPRRGSAGAARCPRPRCRRRRAPRTIPVSAAIRSRTGALTRRVSASTSRLGRRPCGRAVAAAAARSSPARSTTSIRSPPSVALSSSGVPVGDHPAGVDHARSRSASWSASSRYWVVSSTVVPPATSAADRLPDLAAAARVEAGGRLVEEQHRRGQDQAGRQVEPPPHAAGVLLDRLARRCRRGRTAPAARRPARAAPAGPQVVEPAEHHQVLPAAEDLVDGRVLADQPDAGADLGGLAGDVEAGDRGPAAVGAQQGGEDPHGGGLAGAVRAEQAAHGARAAPPGRSRRARPSSP